MEEWKEIEYEDDSDEDSEDLEEELEELDEDSEEDLEDVLKPDTSFEPGFEEEKFQPTFRRPSSEVNPFLESQPIENLEQDLQDVPTQTNAPETGGLEEQGYSNITAQYAEAGGMGGYEGGVNYESAGTTTGSPERDINRALTMRPSDVTLNTNVDGQRGMDFSRWQQSAMGSGAGQGNTQQERYIPPPKKQDTSSTGLPFQGKRNPKTF